MINRMHAYFHRPENGWDPIAASYAASYASHEWPVVDVALLGQLEQWVGGFEGRRILDLGSGPGQYAIAFAARGALVTCHDVSRTYLALARSKAEDLGVDVRMRFSLGYLDHAVRLVPGPWDLVFNRICWYYGFDDRSFADAVFRLVRPGGHGYIDTPHAGSGYSQFGLSTKFRTWLNSHCSIKIGHPFPPRGRLEQLFKRYPLKRLTADYGKPFNDRIWFERADEAPPP